MQQCYLSSQWQEGPNIQGSQGCRPRLFPQNQTALLLKGHPTLLLKEPAHPDTKGTPSVVLCLVCWLWSAWPWVLDPISVLKDTVQALLSSSMVTLPSFPLGMCSSVRMVLTLWCLHTRQGLDAAVIVSWQVRVTFLLLCLGI